MKKNILLLTAFLFSLNSFGQENKDFLLISCFYQGDAKNCASVALIKAAILKFGYKNMFSTRFDNKSFNIILKDGTSFNISESEREAAIQSAKFKIADIPSLEAEKDSVLFYSYLAYASIAKFIATKGYWGCQEGGSRHYDDHNTYGDALRFISRSSFCTDYCNRLLGYKAKEDSLFDFRKTTDVMEKGTILYSKDHAVVTYEDHLDCFGCWIPISMKEMCNNEFKWYIVLQ